MPAPENSPRSVDCPPSPLGCAASAGEPCLSHGGTRERHNFHRARTAAWEAARIAAVPAAQLVADAAARKGVRHAKHAAEMLAANGFTAEAERIRRAVSDRNGLMSAKQAVALLVDEDGDHG
ncbi:zinc finger domain-containing protein [Streptomyces cylindrosporus]|uniref:ANTAR domain-containing protein n=1 Tax=Streptomyces cylindrosporus TaxID=2927583 RepID=A0ABS9YJR3_9ACTN|nr:hypothetical protein [Streptomyces cylindrosporus]MCI3277498.1 hypothetical protein [Streptomyces cylindrosporus]